MDATGQQQTDADGKLMWIDNKYKAKMLGHVTTADADTMVDLRQRMGHATKEFLKGLHLWKHTRISRKSKLRMFRRHVMQLVYAGAHTWLLDDKAVKRLNWWAAGKLAIITGGTNKEECRKRRVHVAAMIRHYRRRMVGEILRAHPDTPARAEMIKHAMLVLAQYIPRPVSFMADCPRYDSTRQLLALAGYARPLAIEQRGIVARARLEQAQIDWKQADDDIRPDYGGENSEDEGSDDDCPAAKKADAEEDKDKPSHEELRAQTEQAVTEAIEKAKNRAPARGWAYIAIIHHC
jgi:hypothetical protein